MTVPVQTPFNSSTGNGVTTVFPYTFLILDEEDIKVTVDGVLKTIATDYTVSGVGNLSGGSVTFLAAPANGTTVVRYSDTLLKRETDYQTNGDFREVVVDADFDRAWLALRDVSYKAERAMRVPAGETAVQLPPADERALSLLGFDAAGVPIASSGVTGAPVSAYMAPVLSAANAAAARALLGFESSSGGDFLVFQNTAAAAEAALRLNTTQATSGISLKLSNSSLNVQAALRGRGDGGLTAHVGQTAGAASTAGVQALDINPTGDVVVGNSGTNATRSVTIYNVNAGASAVSRLRTQTDSGSVFLDVASVAGGSAATLYSNVGSAFSIFTQNAQQLCLGTNNNASRIVLGATGGITFNEDLTFGVGKGVSAKNCAKAWVNFDGSGAGAFRTIRDSFNVTSVADNGPGDYTINFTTALAAGYAWAVGSGSGPSGPPNAGFTQNAPYLTAPSTTAFRIFPGYDIGGGTNDPVYVSAIFFGA